jgi:hypothetical protein
LLSGILTPGPLRGADAGRLNGLDTQHDPGRASPLAWRTGGDDDSLLGALQPLDLDYRNGLSPCLTTHRRLTSPPSSNGALSTRAALVAIDRNSWFAIRRDE